MKRFIVALFLVMFYAGTALAFRPAEYMALTTAVATSTQILSVPGYLYGLMIATDGTYSVTVNLYDSSSGANLPVLIPAWVVTTSASNRAQTLSFDPPLPYNEGVYASGVSTGSYSVIFYYREK